MSVNCQFVGLSATLPTIYRCCQCGWQTPRPLDQHPFNIHRRCPQPDGHVEVGTLQQAKNYVSAVVKWERAGKPVRPDDTVDRLAEEVCQPCEHYRGGKCRACGCPVRTVAEERADRVSQVVGEALRNKLRMATEDCPIRCSRCRVSKWDCCCAALADMWCDDDRRRVLFVLPTIHTGGIEYWMLALAKYLDRTDVQVAVAATDCFSRKMVAELRAVVPVAMGGSAIGRAIPTAGVVVVSALHAPEVLANARGPVLFVSHGRDEWVDHYWERLKPYVTHRAAVSCDAGRVFGLERREVIHSGADWQRIQPTRSRESIRREWGVADSEILVGVVGRVSPEKRPGLVVDAVRLLGKPYRAAIVGPCYMPSMHEWMQTLDADVVRPGDTPIGDALVALDCVVVASEMEGGPLVAMEALAAGTPLVCTDVGAIRDWGDAGYDVGLRVPRDCTAGQIATAIRNRRLSRPIAANDARVSALQWGRFLATLALDQKR